MRPTLLFAAVVAAFPAAAAPLKIACVGDSITAGTALGNPALESYPPRLQRILGTNYTARNFGVSGRTLLKAGDFPYWNESAFIDSRNYNPDIVIIQLGTNDSKPYNWRYGTNFVADYKALIAVYAALPSAPRIYLCTPCPVFGDGAYDIVPGIVQTNIAPLVRGLAAELNLPLIDLQARLTNSIWFPDKVHPDTRGSAAMAAVMFESLIGPATNGDATITAQRVGSSRFAVRWPAAFGNMVVQYATELNPTNIVWTVTDAISYSDGETLSQTNNAFGSIRFYEVRRP